jgi:hypothetical protein
LLFGPDGIHKVKALESLYEKDSFSIPDQRLYWWFYYHSIDIHTPYIYTLSMKTSKTFSNVLENFWKKRQNFVENPIEKKQINNLKRKNVKKYHDDSICL